MDRNSPPRPNSSAIHLKEGVYRREMLRWRADNQRDFPWRRSTDPYEILMAELMLQRTRGENVVPVYLEFLKRWPRPEALARARDVTVAKVLRPLGLTGRSKMFSRLAKELILNGIPTEPHDLQRLPGIGPYASHALPIFGLGRDLPLVDRVIARVLRRFFGLPDEKRPNADKELWQLAERLAFPGGARDLWLGTLDFASAVCRPRPACPTCPLNRWCEEAKARVVLVGSGS